MARVEKVPEATCIHLAVAARVKITPGKCDNVQYSLTHTAEQLGLRAARATRVDRVCATANTSTCALTTFISHGNINTRVRYFGTSAQEELMISRG